jgi:hypothetical protein
MTEIDKEIAKENLFRESFKGKSCRQVYVDECYARELPVNTYVLNMLSPVEDDFEATVFDLSKTIVGANGIFALTSIFRINRKLLSLNLSGQGINDASCALIIEAVKKHNHMNILDISYNPDITDGSSNLLFHLLHENQTLGAIITIGTSIPKAMMRKMDEIAYQHTHLDVIFFRDSTFLELKQMFITKLDYLGSGILTPLEICGLIDNHRLSLAVADRFTKLGYKRNQRMNCETFMSCIHSDFNTMDFLRGHMESTVGDQAEDVVTSNWAMLEQAAENKNCSLSSLQLIHISHRAFSIEDAEEIVEAALRALSASLLAEGLPPLDVSAKVPLPPAILRQVVSDRYAREESLHRQAVSKMWSPSGRIKIAPSHTRKLYAGFVEAAKGEAETEVGAVIDHGCETLTLRLDKAVVKQVLHRNQLGPTINFSFPEWFALVNENYDTVFYRIRSRK